MKFLKAILRHAFYQHADWLIWREHLRSHLIEWNFDVYYYRLVAASQLIFCCDRQINECMASPGHDFYYRTVIELTVPKKNAEKWTRMEYAINETMKFRVARNFTNEQLCKYVPTERRTGIRVAICGACNAYLRFSCVDIVCLGIWLASMCAANANGYATRSTMSKLRTVFGVACVEIDCWRHRWDEPPKKNIFPLPCDVADVECVHATCLFEYIHQFVWTVPYRSTEYALRHTKLVTLPLRSDFVFRNFMCAPDLRIWIYFFLIYTNIQRNRRWTIGFLPTKFEPNRI